MRRLLVVVSVLALALGLSACGGQEPEEEATPQATETPSPEPEPVFAPLTAVPMSDEDEVDRPVLAVKIDNAGPARPQEGLNDADVVFEEIVEGGSTRFLALFHSADPGRVGPIRSGRDVDADLLTPYRPLLVMSGAAEPTLAVLRRAGLEFREEGFPPTFTRDDSRQRPHNLFVALGDMWEVAREAELPPAERGWRFSQDVPSGERVDAARMAFSPSAPVAWLWDADAGQWLREQGGAPHETDGGQVGAANVVVLEVPVARGGGVDVTGAATQHIEVIGEGSAQVLRDGRLVEGRWRKASAEAHFEFVTETGAVIPLAPGRTWVELLPRGAAVSFDRPAATASPSPAADAGSAAR